MSRRYDIIYDIASWCAKKELSQEEVVELVHDVLDDAQQSDYDPQDELSVLEEMKSITTDVKRIYARTLGYDENDSVST